MVLIKDGLKSSSIVRPFPWNRKAESQVANYLERKTEPRSCGVKRKVDVVGLSCTFPNPLVPDVKSFRRRSKLAAASVAVLVRCDVYLIQERKEKIRRKTDLLR